MTEAESLMGEVLRLRTLLRRAAEHLTDHNSDYHHRTPGDFIDSLLMAADGLPASGVLANRHQPLSLSPADASNPVTGRSRRK